MFKLNECFVLRKLYDVHLLIPIKNNKISNDALLLNNTAALIIEKCSETTNIQSLASSVCDEFIDVNNEIFDDIVAYIKKLMKDNIIIER